jgi:hypothetical protein
MKKLKLELLNANGETVRTYHINYDETEGKRMRLTIDDNTYITNTDGKIVILTQEEIDREEQRKHPKLQYFNPKTGKMQGLFDNIETEDDL